MMILCHYFTRVRAVLWRWRLLLLAVVLLCALLLVFVQSGNPATSARFHHHDNRHHDNDAKHQHAPQTKHTSSVDVVTSPYYIMDDVMDDVINAAQSAGENERSMDDSQPLYVPPMRVVHIDLKGAPPSVEYLAHVMRVSARLGANALLLEWEDMLPYSGLLRPAAALNHYTERQVRAILAEAARLQLEVIPLVQTFGHLEHVLKLREFAALREEPDQPAALCPSRNSSRQLVQQLVDQVLQLHPAARRVHIGCDEVFQLGSCQLCRARRLPPERLFVEHVRFVAQHARRQRAGVSVLVWHDMMRQMSARQLRAAELHQLVEPMVWTYAENVERFIGGGVFSTLSRVFGRVWTAGAFKGAFGESLVLPPMRRHVDNTLNWLRVMRRRQQTAAVSTAQLVGFVLTGWQRYDHFSVLCELLPVALPSLAVNLATASHGFFNASLRAVVWPALSCPARQPFVELDDDAADPSGAAAFLHCRFAGVRVFAMAVRCETTVRRARQFVREAGESRGWLTAYAEAHNFSSAFRVDEVLAEAETHRRALAAITGQARRRLARWFDGYTVEEWVEQRLTPVSQQLRQLERRGQRLKARTVWPPRPLSVAVQDGGAEEKGESGRVEHDSSPLSVER